MTARAEKLALLAALEEKRRRQARNDLNAFCRYIDIPGAPVNDDEICEEFYPDTVTPAEHHELINNALMKAARREIDPETGYQYRRLMVFMPPGSAKSTYASVTFPPWYMGAFPNHNVISTSYGTTLSRKFARKVRSIVRSDEYQELRKNELVRDHKAVDDWSTSNGSTYMAGGILSGITGNRSDVLLIDDPVKGRAEAESEIIRDKTWEAYKTDLRTRMKPNAVQILIQTRWHEDDLAGRILPPDYDGESGWIISRDGEPWFVICLQAQCERHDDPLGREIGEWLWTDWFTPKHWQTEKQVQGARNWEALFQQRPKPAEGAMIKRVWIQRYQRPPEKFRRIVCSWDTAYKDKEHNDPSAATVWGERPEGYYLLYVWKDRVKYPELKRVVLSLYQQWDTTVMLIEDKGSGQSLIQEINEGQELVHGIKKVVPVIPIDTEGQSKIDRLVEVSSLFEAGMVYLPEQAPWLPDYERELFAFPLSTDDDQVDSTSQALKYMHNNRATAAAMTSGRRRVGVDALQDTTRTFGSSRHTSRADTRGF